MEMGTTERRLNMKLRWPILATLGLLAFMYLMVVVISEVVGLVTCWGLVCGFLWGEWRIDRLDRLRNPPGARIKYLKAYDPSESNDYSIQSMITAYRQGGDDDAKADTYEGDQS